MNLKSLHAFLTLAVQFGIHVFRKLFRLPSPGLKTFLENYKGDKIPSLSQVDKTQLYSFGRCIRCGLCDGENPVYVQTQNPATFMGPSYYPSGATRLIPDYPYNNLNEQNWQGDRSALICPMGIDVPQTVELMNRKVQEVS